MAVIKCGITIECRDLLEGIPIRLGLSACGPKHCFGHVDIPPLLRGIFLQNSFAAGEPLALQHRVPVVQQYRPFVAAGGLVSYASDESRLVGTYAGRILWGAKPGDLPVQRPTKVELSINSTTPKALGIRVPLSLLGRADEVIE
jgi:hypothetical protein